MRRAQGANGMRTAPGAVERSTALRMGLRTALTAVVAAALGGCASMHGIGTTTQPLQPAALGAQAGPVQWPTEAWWTGLAAPELDQWVRRSLADSPTLATAQARLLRAQAAVAGARAATLPAVNGSADVTHQRFSESALQPRPLAGSSPTLYDMQLGASWELDFFGRNRNALRSALSSERAEAGEQQAARVLITSNVVRSWVQLARLEDQRAVAVAVRQQRVALLELVQSRVRNGLDTNVELRQAEGTVPEIDRDIEGLDEQIALTRHALAALAGAGPDAANDVAPHLPDQATVLRVVSIPSVLPVDLVGRRADIAAAHWRIEAAARQIDVARAAFYPNINLAAAIGLQTLTASQWLDAGSTTWSLGPAVRLPLFEGGRLRANLRGAAADYDAAVASYNGALLDALHDVADQVESLRSIERQTRSQKAAQSAAESALELATLRYKAGLGNFLTVLTAEGNVLAQRRITTDLAARALDARVQLARALGGGYSDSTASSDAKGESAASSS